MKSPASIVGILASSLAASVALLVASDCAADEPLLKWRADPFLIRSMSSGSCPENFKEAIRVEFDGKLLRTSAWSGRTYDMQLLEPLNADGSGTVSAVSMPANRSMVIKFDPGHGPRNIHYWARYSARCVWKFIPIAG